MHKCYACAERETCYVGLNGGCTKCRCFSPDPYKKAELKAKVRTKWGIKPITVTKIKESNKPPIKGNIKVVAEVF